MKRFEFKLESVLHLRARAEMDAQQIHAEAGRRLDAIMAEFTRAEQEWKQLVAELGDLQSRSFRPAERDIIWNATNNKKELCKSLVQKIELARKDVELKRQALLAARRNHESLLKMREKQRQEHVALLEQAERANLDDIINARHMVNRMSRTEAAL